jgi:shikimate kinase/3-dehydroquinate synthase
VATGRLNALGRHLALAGFMGAGKTTVGRIVAERLRRPLVEVDDVVEERAGRTILELFAADGEPAFRALEATVAVEALAAAEPAVVVLGGGAVLDEGTRDALARRAFTVVLDVDPAEAWRRVGGGDRPLARDEEAFHRLYAERRPLYDEVADGRARDADDVVLRAAGLHVELGAIDLLGELVPGDGPVEIVADRHVAGIHGIRAQLALGERDVAVHEVPPGEAAKSASVLERLWSGLRLGRDGVVVALGGGATTDVAGFAAATYMRGVDWVPVPTSLVGQVDAAIGGKTAVDVAGVKNLAGAFHWPARTVVDATLLETLPEPERRNGLAEVVKTGLLAGERLWELPEPDQVRGCAAYKAAVCLADPFEHGSRAQLNLGHTFGHALEAAAGYTLPHGEAVALGLLAALRLSGLEEERRTVAQVLEPRRPSVDPQAAWAALTRDKKARGGAPRLVLLDAPGKPRWGVTLPAADVRAALEELIAS